MAYNWNPQTQSYRPPGPKHPEKYPIPVGPAYMSEGEQPGFIYDPWTDTYRPDPKTVNDYGIQTGLQEKPPKQPGLGEVLLPIAGVGAALAGGQALGNNLPGIVGDIGSGALGLLGMGPAAPAGIGPVASGADYGAMLGTGTTTATEGAGATLAGAAPWLGAAGAGLGAYGLYEGIQNNDPKSSALGGLGLGGGLAMAAPLAGFAPLGLPAIGLAALGGGLLGYGAGKFFGHESTGDVQKKHTGQLLDQGEDNAAWQNYVAGMRQGMTGNGGELPFAGKYKTFDEYKAAGLDPTDLEGVYGNLKTYGPDWANYTPEQRRAITQANINSGIYDSKKGEVVITDSQAALRNRDAVLSGALQPNTPASGTQGSSPATGQTSPAAGVPLQSEGASPDMNRPQNMSQRPRALNLPVQPPAPGLLGQGPAAPAPMPSNMAMPPGASIDPGYLAPGPSAPLPPPQFNPPQNAAPYNPAPAPIPPGTNLQIAPQPQPQPAPTPAPMPGRGQYPSGMPILMGPNALRDEELRIRPIGLLSVRQ